METGCSRRERAEDSSPSPGAKVRTKSSWIAALLIGAAACGPFTTGGSASDEGATTTIPPDGGTAQSDAPQLDGGTSDAYATGSALVALHLTGGLATDSPTYREGLKFLIANQRNDGSWFVASRSKPFQKYFETGFPHKEDQFISSAATSWAVTAMALSCEKPTSRP